MAENTSASNSRASNDEKELREIKDLLWGPNIRLDVFRRWSQGFEFSDIEPSALVQKQGGPCAVIAPVQAFLLKTFLMETPEHNLCDLTLDKCKRLLIQALCNILMKCETNNYRIVVLPADACHEVSETSAQIRRDRETSGSGMDDVESSLSSSAVCNMVGNAMTDDKDAEGNIKIDEDHEIMMNNDDDDNMKETLGKAIATPGTSEQVKIAELGEWTPEQFHERLSVLNIERIRDIEIYYTENFSTLIGTYGVLLFMYTVLLTKGLENVLNELSDTSEPLIHNTYGYGSQALINLMLTGRAVAHVWDNDQDVGGLKLRGINQQSDVGFITLMEQMRYCTVGSFYKNPKNPVWVMGSETHLSVLFSNEKRLVSPETPCEIARRVFKSYDPDGNNFIQSAVLQDVLCSLDLFSDPGYVEIMRKKLDSENLGIILLNAFMDEFFPEDQRSTPDTFDLLHYNGIPGSNIGNKVKYCKGSAILLESDLKSMCSASNLMLTCLQTKWPNIEVNWHDMRIPSLN